VCFTVLWVPFCLIVMYVVSLFSMLSYYLVCCITCLMFVFCSVWLLFIFSVPCYCIVCFVLLFFSFLLYVMFVFFVLVY
jgi:hypothetical protein